MRRAPAVALAVTLALAAAAATAAARAEPSGRLRLEVIGRYDGGVYSPQAVQNPPAWDAAANRLYLGSQVRARIDILDLSDPADPALVGTIGLANLPPGTPLAKVGGGISALAFRDGVLAASFAAVDKGTTGILVLFDRSGRALTGAIDLGHAPNALAFVPDRPLLLAVNQADPGAQVDPPASLTLVRLDPGAGTGVVASVSTISFAKFDGSEAALRAAGIRLITPGASASQELEPESVAIAADGRTAWVTLPRNNAIAVVDLGSEDITALLPLGTKNMQRLGNGFDASDQDGRIAIRPWPVEALYEPDGIAVTTTSGRTVLVTANEGDPRPGEEVRVGEAALDPVAFPHAARLQRPENLGRLQVTRVESDPDGDGDLDRLVALGARSLAVWTIEGRQLADTGSLFERVARRQAPEGFNTTDDASVVDARSDDRGPEPESIAIGKIGGRSIAFVAFERMGGVIAVDVTVPSLPRFQDYQNTRNYAVDASGECTANQPKSPRCAEAGDLGPESLLFIAADESPTGEPLLLVRHDLSDTLTISVVRTAGGPGGARESGR